MKGYKGEETSILRAGKREEEEAAVYSSANPWRKG